MSASGFPLEGIRVLDFTWVMAGPTATRLLANFGAEVIKVESAMRVDLGRAQMPIIKGTQQSAQFLNANTDKLCVSINMGDPRGRDIARRLVSLSDIVTDNFAPGVMERWGLGYEELTRIKPDIIMAEMPVMGKTGPRAEYGGYGPGLQAMAGLNYLTGFPNRPPTPPRVALPDFTSNPLHTVTAILAALHYREKTGRGQYIELAQYQSTVCMGGVALLDYMANGRIAMRDGNRIPNATPHGVYRCQGDDRWCAIAVFSDEEWQSFCRAAGKPDWAADARFSSLDGRKEHEDELDYLVGGWTINKTAEEVMLLLQHAGVAAGVAQNGQDLIEHDPQIKARDYYVTLQHPEAGEITCEQVSIKLSRTPGKVRRTGPGLGEHNEYIFKELLGLDEEEIDRYYVEDVFK